jgi:DNA-binding NarL/FixJ family response regulator
MNRCRVVLIDDNPLFLAAAGDFLAADPRLEVVARLHRPEGLPSLLHSVGVDVVVMDLVMPGLNGFQSTRLFKACQPAPRIVLVSLFDGPEFRRHAELAGADGYVAKERLIEDLVPVVLALGSVLPQP